MGQPYTVNEPPKTPKPDFTPSPQGSQINTINDGTEIEVCFGVNSEEELHEALKRNKELVEEGFDIKESRSTQCSVLESSSPKINENDAQLWKDRYYKLLDVLNTFKGNQNE